MSVTFTKLFSSITESTIWCEPSDIRIVWITMLAMADRKGRVFGSVPGLANRAQVPIQSVRDAIQAFLSPDLDSRTPENEGRRIEGIDGGWRLLNHAKYRSIRDEEERRAYKTEKQREYRKPVDIVDKSGLGGPLKTGEDACAHNAEADSDSEASNPPTPKGESVEFIEFWKAYPRKAKKPDAIRAFKKHKCADFLPEILGAIDRFRNSRDWQKDDGAFIPYPASWLNSRRWEDEVGLNTTSKPEPPHIRNGRLLYIP